MNKGTSFLSQQRISSHVSNEIDNVMTTSCAKPMGENTINNMVGKQSVAGTSLEERGKKFTNHIARKITVSNLKIAYIVRSNIVKVTGRRSVISLDHYNEADEEQRQRLSLADPNEIMKTPALRKGKYWQFLIPLWLLLPIGGSVRWKKTNGLVI